MTASKLRTFLFVAGALLAGAIAQAQQASQTSKPTAATASSTIAASPAAQSSDAKSAAARKAAADLLVRDARDAGFHPESIRGTLMFCRTATELGSNFPVRTCYNEEQVRVKIDEYRTERAQMESRHGLPNEGN